MGEKRENLLNFMLFPSTACLYKPNTHLGEFENFHHPLINTPLV